MYKKQECVAMLLAGGQGSRLYTLTEKTAKPAVRFGGKYRIIDFPLSNCVNSGIYTVGVLTQYQPLQLNEYIGNGQPWDLDRGQSGVMVLPPYQAKSGADWYKGTANAIYQNFNFIDRYSPDYVLILSGDHIYKMDYEVMLDFHKYNGADVTIAVMPVPLEEAKRFGIVITDENRRITDFEEKPEHPRSNLASMGIYIFNWDILEKYLTEDENNPESSNDFGNDVIPALLRDNRRMYAYRFDGYWKDVGTISSLWEANMELLGTDPEFNLYGDGTAPIFARNYALPSSYIDTGSKNIDSLIAEGCEIYGSIRHSVISTGCKVGKDALIEDAVIMPNTIIEPGVIIRNAIIGEGCTVRSGAVIGGAFREGEKRQISVVGKDHVIEANQVVKPGDVI